MYSLARKYLMNVVYRSRDTRGGISLIEVLISIFILAVGILSIASLLPLGQNQVARADQLERSAMIGQSAFKTFRTRGFSNPQWWRYTGTAGDIKSGTNFNFFNEPILIDPYFVANAGPARSPHAGQATPAKAPTNIPRFTIKTTPDANGFDMGTALPAIATEGIFVSRDDKILDEVNSPEDAARFRQINGTGAKDYEGRYSWMAMLAPAYPGLIPPGATAGVPYPEMPCELTVIVFDRRQVLGGGTVPLLDTLSVPGQSIPLERLVNVSAFDGAGIGGGEITIQATNWSDLLVKPTEYLLLYKAGNNQTGANAKYFRARWYRIVSAEKLDANQTTRQITLAGPDWDTTDNYYRDPKAIIFDNAVGVYTKSIKLEGPSQWN